MLFVNENAAGYREIRLEIETTVSARKCKNQAAYALHLECFARYQRFIYKHAHIAQF